MTAKNRKRNSVALDIETELSRRNVSGRLSVIVEGMPLGAALSAGTNNWDKTWSLTVADLTGLKFQFSENDGGDHVISVRVLHYDDDGYEVANTVALFDMTVKSPNAGPDLEQEEKEILAAARAEWDAAASERLAEAKAKWDEDAERSFAVERSAWENETASQLATERAKWDSEARRQLSKLKAIWQAELQEQSGDLKITWLEDEERQLAVEKGAWEKRARDRVESEKAEWDKQAKGRLAAAKASWRAEEEKQLTEARTELESESKRRHEDTVSRSTADIEDALAAARAVWEVEAEQRLNESEANWRADVERRIGDIRAAFENEAQERLKNAEERWKANTDEQLAAAQDAWQASAEQLIMPTAGDDEASVVEPDAEWQREVAARRATADAKEEIKAAKKETQARRKQAKIEIWRNAEERHRQTTVQVQKRIAVPRSSRKRAAAAVVCAGLVAAGVVLMVRTSADPTTVIDRVAPVNSVPEPRLLYVRPNSAVVRAEATSKSTALSSLPRNTAVQELRRSGEWVQVAFPDSGAPMGWVHGTLLRTEIAATR